MALAGFTPAPLMGPLMRMAAASADPMAMAATARGTRLSVATEMITRTRMKVTTASAAKTRPRPTPEAGYVAPRYAWVRACLPYRPQVTAAAPMAPASWPSTYAGV